MTHLPHRGATPGQADPTARRIQRLPGTPATRVQQVRDTARSVKLKAVGACI